MAERTELVKWGEGACEQDSLELLAIFTEVTVSFALGQADIAVIVP